MPTTFRPLGGDEESNLRDRKEHAFSDGTIRATVRALADQRAQPLTKGQGTTGRRAITLDLSPAGFAPAPISLASVKIVLLVPLIAAAASACAASGAREVDKTGPTVTYEYAGERLKSAYQRAWEHCSDYGLWPELISLESDGANHRAIFECT